jgi:hypothetical protein
MIWVSVIHIFIAERETNMENILQDSIEEMTLASGMLARGTNASYVFRESDLVIGKIFTLSGGLLTSPSFYLFIFLIIRC